MANITTQTIRVDLNTGKVIPTAFTHQNDTNRQFIFEVYNNNVEYSLSGFTAKFGLISPIVNGQHFVIAGSSMESGTISGNTVTVTLPEAYNTAHGVGLLTMILTSSGKTIRPINIRYVVQKSADGPDAITSASDFPITLQGFVDEWFDNNSDEYLDAWLTGALADQDLESVVNNWLDDHPEATTTVQDGALTIQKLNDALRKNIIRQYDTADLMKADTSLKNGEICHTNGFKTSGDGGGAWYKITSTGTANNMDVLACGNVFANLVVLDNEIIPEQIGAVINGVCNVSAFQRLFDLAKTVKIVSDFTINFVNNSTVDSPTRVKIENKTGVTVLGNSHTVTMSGLTKSYLESINDRSSSGRDIFTFLAFHGCQNVTVKDLNFVGTNAADAENSFRFASPRSICVGFKGCTNCIAENINGENILGNVVNASTADDLSTGCNKIFITNCKAENCYENGFNIMGESTDCMIDGCVSVRCGTGAEAFGDSCIIQNCYIESAWSSGISISGGATARNNKVVGSIGTRAGIGIGISVTGASSLISENCKVFNNHVADCKGYGIYVYPYTENTEVKGNLFENNNTLNTYGMANNMSGVAANKTKDVIMADNVFKSTIDEQKCFLADNVNGIMFINNIVDHVLSTSVYSINFSASCENIKACGNTLTKRVNVSTSATNYFVGNNVVGKTIPEINAD